MSVSVWCLDRGDPRDSAETLAEAMSRGSRVSWGERDRERKKKKKKKTERERRDAQDSKVQ